MSRAPCRGLKAIILVLSLTLVISAQDGAFPCDSNTQKWEQIRKEVLDGALKSFDSLSYNDYASVEKLNEIAKNQNYLSATIGGVDCIADMKIEKVKTLFIINLILTGITLLIVIHK